MLVVIPPHCRDIICIVRSRSAIKQSSYLSLDKKPPINFPILCFLRKYDLISDVPSEGTRVENSSRASLSFPRPRARKGSMFDNNSVLKRIPLPLPPHCRQMLCPSLDSQCSTLPFVSSSRQGDLHADRRGWNVIIPRNRCFHQSDSLNN